jgi:16S rRNA (uracil1498-N3)-methyltransferase
MRRFYCPDISAPDAAREPTLSAALDREQSHHALRVLRLRPGDAVRLFNGNGTVAEGVIKIAESPVQIRLTDIRQSPPLTPRLTIACALPKGPRADDMVNQLSQLGTDRLIPLRTRHSVVDPRDKKLDRFRKSAIESAKQCGRDYVMAVEDAADLAAVLSQPYDVKLLGDPAGKPLATVGAACDVLVLIGPEGGWTDQEMQQARDSGCVTWRFAPYVLRIETAAVAAAAIIRSSM